MTKKSLMIIGLVLSSMGVAATATAAELRVLSAGSLKLAMDHLLPDFQKSSGDMVTIDYGTAGAIAGRIQKGELADVVMVSRSQVETLESQGKVAAGSRVNIASVGVGVAIRKGAPRPDISSVEAFKRTLISAQSVGYVNPALGSSSGIYVAAMLERLGIAQDLKSKIKLVTVGGDIDSVFQGVASGEIEMQIGQISEIAISPGVDLAGPLPNEIQNFTLLAACQIASNCDPFSRPKVTPSDGAKTGVAEPDIAEQSRCWRAPNCEPGCQSASKMTLCGLGDSARALGADQVAETARARFGSGTGADLEDRAHRKAAGAFF